MFQIFNSSISILGVVVVVSSGYFIEMVNYFLHEDRL